MPIISAPGLDDVEDFSKPIEAPYVEGVVEGFEQKVGKASGNPYIVWELSLAWPEGCKGRKLWHSTPVSGKGLGILKTFLSVCGVEWTPQGFDTNDVMGAAVRCALKTETYEGVERSKIASVLPPEELA